MKRTILPLTAFLISLSASAQVQITAHRGFWEAESAGKAQNSIASLKAAQDIGVWGSEFDVQLTSDDVLLVNHDDNREGLLIRENPYSVFAAMSLPNGEHPSTLEAYLDQGLKAPGQVLVFELKSQKGEDREDLLVDRSLEALQVRGQLDPSRVIFISFSYHICRRLVEKLPGFMVQYLSGNKTPEELHADGITGIDYHYKVIRKNPDYVTRAHALGMAVNVWTVDNPEDIREMVDAGVDCITTNKPLLVREILGDREVRAVEDCCCGDCCGS